MTTKIPRASYSEWQAMNVEQCLNISEVRHRLTELKLIFLLTLLIECVLGVSERARIKEERGKAAGEERENASEFL